MTLRSIDPRTSLVNGPGILLGICGDLFAATWLFFVFSTYTQSGGSAPWRSLFFGVVFSVSFRVSTHVLPSVGGLTARFRHAGLILGSGIVAALVASAYTASAREVVWLATATGVLACTVRSALAAYQRGHSDPASELLRWIALTTASTALYIPFYRQSSVGSGDAHWYTLMVADIAEQWRHGQFPSWVGESLYAFNGAVDPLRLAPLLQHVGAFISLLTTFTMAPVALTNATLAFAGLFSVFSAYLSVRMLAPSSRWFAAGIATLWAASPGVLGPPMLSDMYLSAMAMGFIPPVFACSWLLLTKDGIAPRLGLSACLAGAWLGHAPIAAWMTLVAAACWVWHLRDPRARQREGRLLAIGAGAFIILGSLPFLSTLSLRLKTPVTTTAEPSLQNIHESFPGIFLPISNVSGAGTLQTGYSLFIIAGLVLLLGGRKALATSLVFITCVLAIALLVIPLPWVNSALWSAIPKAFINVQGSWPEQRLMAVWGFALVATAAVSFHHLEASKIKRWGLAAVVGACLVWSGCQASLIILKAYGNPDPDSITTSATDYRNLVMGIDSYFFFPRIPGSASHGYVDPYLEFRLLDKATLGTLASNADSAAPALAADTAPGYPSRLLDSGTFTATNDNFSAFYNLSPGLSLPKGVRVALRLAFIESPINGYLQITAPDLFREYMLPDSGGGITLRDPPRSFGALPTSGSVIPLGIAPQAETIEARLILPGHKVVPSLPAARYWLYRYSPDDLPIRVHSFTPLRAEVLAPCDSWLETTRVWMEGYSATVDGQSALVTRSPDNLVLVSVPKGTSSVRLTYSAPLILSVSYWVTLGGWAVIIALFLQWALRARRA